MPSSKKKLQDAASSERKTQRESERTAPAGKLGILRVMFQEQVSKRQKETPGFRRIQGESNGRE